MSQAKLQAAREFIMAEHYDTARAILSTMKASSTAQKWLAKLDEIAPAEEQTVSQWEYQEVYIRSSDRNPPDLEGVIDDRQFTTVDHFYSRLLNDYGAEGWEMVSEEPAGADLVRLLLKRPRRDE